MENKNEFTEGIYFNKKYEKAPEYVLGKLAIYKDKFIAWLQSRSEDKIYLEIKEGKERPYIQVDSFKPKDKEPKKETLEGGDGLNPDDIPF